MNKRNITILSLIVLAVITRLLPHPPNVAPITAIALFGGSRFDNKWIGFSLPLLCMFLSDLFLGFHGTIYWVYGSLLLVVILGMLLINKVNIKNCAAAAFSGSFLFFLITNFGVWLSSPYYTKNIEGILSCYTLALPFLGNTLAGSLFYSAVMFGGYELLKRSMALSAPESIQK